PDLLHPRRLLAIARALVVRASAPKDLHPPGMLSVPCVMAGLRLHPILVAAAVTLVGCNRAPAEPDAPGSSQAAAAPVAPPLRDAPAGWAKLDVPASGSKKASYRVDKAGDDKEGAQVDVLFYGTGAKGDPTQNFKEWFAEFDGNVGATAVRDTFEAHGLA